MNIFAFHKCPASAACDHCDRHVCKMTIEYAQLLSTALLLHGIKDSQLYKMTHQHGRFAQWAATSSSNFEWLLELFVETALQYQLRYRKTHATFIRMQQGLVFEKYKLELPNKNLTPPPVAKLEGLTKWAQVTRANREYFNEHKQHIARWKFGEPTWYRPNHTG